MKRSILLLQASYRARSKNQQIVTGSDGALEASIRLQKLYRDLDHLYEVITMSNKIFVEYSDPCIHFDATARWIEIETIVMRGHLSWLSSAIQVYISDVGALEPIYSRILSRYSHLLCLISFDSSTHHVWTIRECCLLSILAVLQEQATIVS